MEFVAWSRLEISGLKKPVSGIRFGSICSEKTVSVKRWSRCTCVCHSLERPQYKAWDEDETDPMVVPDSILPCNADTGRVVEMLKEWSGCPQVQIRKVRGSYFRKSGKWISVKCMFLLKYRLCSLSIADFETTFYLISLCPDWPPIRAHRNG